MQKYICESHPGSIQAPLRVAPPLVAPIPCSPGVLSPSTTSGCPLLTRHSPCAKAKVLGLYEGPNHYTTGVLISTLDWSLIGKSVSSSGMHQAHPMQPSYSLVPVLPWGGWCQSKSTFGLHPERMNLSFLSFLSVFTYLLNPTFLS